jgi:hypothetical protein
VSRAEPIGASRSGLSATIRVAAIDFYFNSWRLVPANLLWGAVFAIALVGIVIHPAGSLLVPLLALPTVGIYRIAALIARADAASFWDGLAAWRAFLVPALLLGTALAGCEAILLGNVVFGLASGSLSGWALATLAGWGLAASWILSWTLWPLLVDPRREDQSVRTRLRTAVALAVARPRRAIALGAAMFVFLAVSTVAFAALVSVSMAFAALVACREVLPAADRLEGRLADRGFADP